MHLLIKLREAHNKIDKLEDERRIILEEKNVLEMRLRTTRSYLISLCGKMVCGCEPNILHTHLVMLKSMIVDFLSSEYSPEECAKRAFNITEFINNMICGVTKNAE